ncbi:uncharacterized protein Pyn_20031 [Prunus yedoensis var. nudiflora]|uniref:Senescence domain-containing protein n=1 Tax=Prunus yedoensis var. nudiflora TaxID=2094558 RepID=A0A314YZR5_PRUYE|nr:uncharacterized protein Pyn_20031 [Prunus yedoensis var. nudiflora]
MKDLAENLFPEDDAVSNRNTQSSEELLVKIPGAIVHLIEKDSSIELATGELTIVSLRQNGNIVAVLARVGDQIQWPLARDEAAVKLDQAHYFFTLRVPANGSPKRDEIDEQTHQEGQFVLLNYGLTFASSKGQEVVFRRRGWRGWGIGRFWIGSVGRDTCQEERAAAYWTTLAPNVEDYSGKCARLIAAGSGQVIRGILWCGDVTVDRLKWGNESLKIRMGPTSESEISPEALKRMQRVKKLTKMSEDVASGILSGVVKVSGFFTSSIVNSTVGQKFFSLLPGEIVLASLDGFNKVCDAVEVAGRNVMSTTSVVTTGLVSQRYGESAAKVTNEGLDAAGHAIGTAWAVFKVRRALNPKSVLKPTTLVKAAAESKSSKLKSQTK